MSQFDFASKSKPSSLKRYIKTEHNFDWSKLIPSDFQKAVRLIIQMSKKKIVEVDLEEAKVSDFLNERMRTIVLANTVYMLTRVY